MIQRVSLFHYARSTLAKVNISWSYLEKKEFTGITNHGVLHLWSIKFQQYLYPHIKISVVFLFFQWCNPSSSTSTWSNRDGVACDDGKDCTRGDTCSSGQCVATPFTCNSLCQDCNGNSCSLKTGYGFVNNKCTCKIAGGYKIEIDVIARFLLRFPYLNRFKSSASYYSLSIKVHSAVKVAP